MFHLSFSLNGRAPSGLHLTGTAEGFSMAGPGHRTSTIRHDLPKISTASLQLCTGWNYNERTGRTAKCGVQVIKRLSQIWECHPEPELSLDAATTGLATSHQIVMCLQTTNARNLHLVTNPTNQELWVSLFHTPSWLPSLICCNLWGPVQDSEVLLEQKTIPAWISHGQKSLELSFDKSCELLNTSGDFLEQY